MFGLEKILFEGVEGTSKEEVPREEEEQEDLRKQLGMWPKEDLPSRTFENPLQRVTKQSLIRRFLQKKNTFSIEIVITQDKMMYGFLL